MRRRFFIIVLILLSVFQYRPSSAANIDTSLRFSTIETEHFSIHFHQGIEELAQKAAIIAEGVHEPLLKEFNWAPREKTQLVLIDDTDFTNGFATVLPYNTIYIKVVPPSLDMTIGEYEDWLKMLIVHEYSHILTMDSARGYSEVMRSVFGKPLPGLNLFSFLMFIASAPPNVFLPSWWHEGIATWGETEYAGIGRGTSTFYEMILRMAVAENNIPSLDQIIGEVPYWPDGHMPYIFGLRLQKYIADRYGKEALGRLNTAHAGRFPYFINGATLGLFGKDYPTLYTDMIRDLKNEEKKRIDALRQAPFTPF
ncbi:MAG: peptidase S9, partial [Deltaproteobacteria bacterium]